MLLGRLIQAIEKGAQEVRWLRICYRYKKKVREIPLYNIETKRIMDKQAYETRVCDRYAIICTHDNDKGAPLCLGHPLVHDHVVGEPHEKHSAADRVPGCVAMFPGGFSDRLMLESEPLKR